MEERINKQLEFSLEIDKVKNVFRQTHLSQNGRNENDAEHSWHICSGNMQMKILISRKLC